MLWLLKAFPDPFGWALPVSWVCPDLWRSVGPLHWPCKHMRRASGCPVGMQKLLGQLVHPPLYQLMLRAWGLQGLLSPAPPHSTAAFALPFSFFWEKLYVLPSFLLHCPQWASLESDSKQIDHSVPGCSSPSWHCSSNSDPQTISSAAVLAMMLSRYSPVAQ